MMRALVSVLMTLTLGTSAFAQVTIPYPNFQPNEDILSSEVNSNFSTLSSKSLNREGGTVSGAIASSGGSLTGSWGGSPTFSGGPTFSGTATHSGTLTSSGATLSGTWAGAPTFSGAANFTGAVTFTSGSLTSSGSSINGTWSGTPTMSGVWTHAANVVQNFSTNDALELYIQNSSTGSSARSRLRLGNANESQAGQVVFYGSNFITSGPSFQDGMLVDSARPGGLSIAATGAAGALRFYTGGSTMRWSIDNTGTLISQAHDIVFGDNSSLRRGTSDASDTGALSFTGGGAAGTGRGGVLQAYGNENGSAPGYVQVLPGDVSGSRFRVTNGSTGIMDVQRDGRTAVTTSESDVLTLTSNHASGGYLRFNYNNGGGNAFSIGSMQAINGSGGANNLLFSILGGGTLNINAGFQPEVTDTQLLGSVLNRWLSVVAQKMLITDGISTPLTAAGHATLYVDSADGDLKVKFGDGTVRTVVAD